MRLNDFDYCTDDIIQTDKIKHFVTENDEHMLFIKTDTFKSMDKPVTDVKTGTIVVGNSDYSVTSAMWDNVKNAYNCMYAVNCSRRNLSDNMHALPLGVSNSYNNVHGDTSIIRPILSRNKNVHNLVYMNFDVGTYQAERSNVYDKFHSKKWVTTGTYNRTPEDRLKFLNDTYDHAFTLCPHGNGIDTHRVWESLYLKTIPIVKRAPEYDDFKDLPIAFVNDWSDVTVEWLLLKYNEIHNKEWNMYKLTCTWWFNKLYKSSKYFMQSFSHIDSENEPLDLKLLRLFPQQFKKQSGFFIDAGANDGLTRSNTALLENTYNWSGILIEPSASAYDLCVKSRLSMCVNTTLIESPCDDSNLSKEHAHTLNTIVDQYKPPEIGIDFLSLSVEGFKLQVLQGLNFSKYPPAFILTKLYQNETEKIVEFLVRKGYVLHSNFSNHSIGTTLECNNYLFVRV